MTVEEIWRVSVVEGSGPVQTDSTQHDSDRGIGTVIPGGVSIGEECERGSGVLVLGVGMDVDKNAGGAIPSVRSVSNQVG